jgi:hypothetical protein
MIEGLVVSLWKAGVYVSNGCKEIDDDENRDGRGITKSQQPMKIKRS